MKRHRPELRAGDMGFNQGCPVRLLWFLRIEPGGDVWHVEPIFLEGPEREEMFRPNEFFRKIHG